MESSEETDSVDSSKPSKVIHFTDCNNIAIGKDIVFSCGKPLQQELEELRSKTEELQQSFTSKVDALHDDNQHLRSEIRQLQKSMQQLQLQNKIMIEKIDNLEKRDSTPHILTEIQNKKLSGLEEKNSIRKNTAGKKRRRSWHGNCKEGILIKDLCTIDC
ncbi:hypothetical protein SNE40_002630 [Patella caerulea]|uniref:Uncharacterized protein n=1 Tax=Patella caerulea TaxID=87958 RepID=A0AAN8KG97_PATCE